MMKSILLYRLTAESVKVLNNHILLTQALETKPEKLPVASQWRTLGFGLPAPGASDELVWNGAGNVNMFCLKIHKRDLSGATIKEFVAKRAAKIEERESRKVYRKEYAQLKEEVEAELLPKAFIKHSAILMMAIGDLLVVGASTAKNAEDALSTLRDAIGTLGVRPFTTKVAPEEWLTKRILRDGKVGDLVRGDSAKLANEAKDVVTFKGVNLGDEEPQAYADSGFRVKEISLDFRGDMFFRMTDTLIIKGIKFTDTLITSSRRDTDGDLAATVDADIILFSDSITGIVETLIDELGEERAYENDHSSSHTEIDDDIDALDLTRLEKLARQFRRDNPNLRLVEQLGDDAPTGHLEDLHDDETRERLLREQFSPAGEEPDAVDPLDPDEDF